MKKNLLITGANGNLGKAVIAMFLDAGYAVWELVHDDFPFRSIGKDHWQGGVNLLNEDAVSLLVDAVKQNVPQIDLLVCTAGGFKTGTFQHTNDHLLKEMIDLNFLTAFNIVKPVFKIMEEQGKGNIFLVGANPGNDMSQAATNMAYALSKSLIFRFAEFLNIQSHAAEVKTYVLVPSTIDTPENRESMPDKDFTQWVKPETIARSILTTCQSQSTREHKPIMPF